jgi:hypothetical protein
VSVFEVAIGPDAAAGKYRVDVLAAPDGGIASAIVALDLDGLLARRRDLERTILVSGMSARGLTPEEEYVRAVGRLLFTALLGTGEVAGRYRVAAALAIERGEALRVVLRIADPALAALPWEAMYDDGHGGYVCRYDQLVRHVGALAPVPPLLVDPPLRVLGVVSAPRDQQHLNVAAEQDRLREALRTLIADGLAQLDWTGAATWADVQDKLQDGPWHVFHFIGHGDFDEHADEGVLAFTNEAGRTQRVGASRLSTLLRTADPLPRLVVLNSCSGATSSSTDLFAGTATALVRSGIPAVAAMQYSISDAAALAFSRGFYGALARGRAVDEAITSARTAILGLTEHTLEWVTPVLYLRGDQSRLFTLTSARQSPPPTQRSQQPQRSGQGRAEPRSTSTGKHRVPASQEPPVSDSPARETPLPQAQAASRARPPSSYREAQPERFEVQMRGYSRRQVDELFERIDGTLGRGPAATHPVTAAEVRAAMAMFEMVLRGYSRRQVDQAMAAAEQELRPRSG